MKASPPRPMNPALWGAAVLMALVLLPAAAQAQRYELVWSDEFDTLDRATWRAWTGTAYNNELQYYTARDTNVYVRDGLLYLWAQNEKFGGRDYTSARLESEPQGGHRYGRFEARAKMPSGFGLWPAIWLLPTQVSWPRDGEIDIMEWRGDLPARTYGTVHYQRGGQHAYTGTTWDLPQGTFSDTFHVFAVEWDEVGIRWFVDGLQFHEIRKATLGADPYPFDSKNFYWILNVAVGGDFLPNPPAGSEFRQAMVVDYVRVYQDANQKPTTALAALPDTVDAGAVLPLALTAADTDGQVDSVAIYVNGTRVAGAAGARVEFAFPAAVVGCYDIEGRAYDNDGGMATAQRRVVVGAGCTPGAYGGEPLSLPGTLRFSNYDYGGQGVGYFDATPEANTGNAAGNTFRPNEGVDLRPHPSDAEASVVTDVQAGEWLSYTVDVSGSGLYDLTVHALAPTGYGRVRIQVDEETVVRSLLLGPGTPEQPAVQATAAGVSLPPGRHVLRVTALFDGFELDRMEVTTPGGTDVGDDAGPGAPRLFAVAPHPVRGAASARFELAVPGEATLQVVDVLGHVVATAAEGFHPAGLHTVPIDRAGLASGLYLLRLVTSGGTQARPMIVVD